MVYALWALAMLAGLAPRGVANDLLFLPLYFLAGLATLQAAGVRPGNPRAARGWQLVGLAWITSGVGAMMFTAAMQWESGPLHMAATVTYQLYYPLVLAGIWFLTELPAGRAGRSRLAVEGLIVMVATVILAWYCTFRFEDAYSSLGPYLNMLLVVFPGELAIALGATAVVHHASDVGQSRHLSLFSVGTLAAVVADFIYQHHALTGAAESAVIGDMLLALAAILVASAGMAATRAADRARCPAVPVGFALVPYLAILVVAALAVFQWWAPDQAHPALAGLVLGGAVLMGLLILRLRLAQGEFAREAHARAELDARFRALVQRSSDAVLVVDGEGRIRYANPPFSAMTGSLSADLTGRLLSELVTLDSTLGFSQGLSDPAEAQWVRWKTAGGREIDAKATDLTADPVIGGIVINARDVTEQTLLEAQLQQAHKLEAVGKFASSVAHDFNNVLAVISANLFFALRDQADQPSEELLQIEAATERAAALARQLTALGRPSAGATATLDLAAATRSMEKVLRLLLPSSIQTTVRTPAEPLVVRLDEARVEQILLNLAINARDAMPQGGRLEILVEATGDTGAWRGARVVVRDTGSGMAPEVLQHAFDLFYTTKESGIGTGLGLPSVRSIVRDIGGEVTLESEPGRGTAVIIELPLVAPRAVAPPPSAHARFTEGSGRVLVVDDDAAVRHVVARYLERVGYQVTEKGDGRAALEYLEWDPESIDLVLTDLVMPNMGGEALARAIATRWPQLGILCMSGTPGAVGSGDEPWSFERVIAKPAQLPMIAARVAEVLQRRDVHLS